MGNAYICTAYIYIYLQLCWDCFLGLHGYAWCVQGGSNMSRQGEVEPATRKLWLLVGIMKYAKEIDEIDTGFSSIFWFLYAGFQGLSFLSSYLNSSKELKEHERHLDADSSSSLRVPWVACWKINLYLICFLQQAILQTTHFVTMSKVNKFSRDMAKFLVPWMLIYFFDAWLKTNK